MTCKELLDQLKQLTPEQREQEIMLINHTDIYHLGLQIVKTIE